MKARFVAFFLSTVDIFQAIIKRPTIRAIYYKILLVFKIWFIVKINVINNMSINIIYSDDIFFYNINI